MWLWENIDGAYLLHQLHTQHTKSRFAHKTHGKRPPPPRQHPTPPYQSCPTTIFTHARVHEAYGCQKTRAERMQANTPASHTPTWVPSDLPHAACVREPPTHSPHHPQHAAGVLPSPPPMSMHIEYVAIGKHRRSTARALNPHTTHQVPFCTQNAGKTTPTTTSTPHTTIPILPHNHSHACMRT